MGAFDDELATLREGEKLDDGLPAPIDWDALFARENEIDWLVDDVWPAGRQLHIFAARKTGKSLLMLWMAANLAAGRDPFSGQAREHVRIAYLDYEMTEDDLLERVEEMGFMPDDLRGRLFYYLWPTIPALDTYDGGQALMRLLQRDEAAAVILDTMSPSGRRRGELGRHVPRLLHLHGDAAQERRHQPRPARPRGARGGSIPRIVGESRRRGRHLATRAHRRRAGADQEGGADVVDTRTHRPRPGRAARLQTDIRVVAGGDGGEGGRAGRDRRPTRRDPTPGAATAACQQDTPPGGTTYSAKRSNSGASNRGPSWGPRFWPPRGLPRGPREQRAI